MPAAGDGGFGGAEGVRCGGAGGEAGEEAVEHGGEGGRQFDEVGGGRHGGVCVWWGDGEWCSWWAMVGEVAEKSGAWRRRVNDLGLQHGIPQMAKECTSRWVIRVWSTDYGEDAGCLKVWVLPIYDGKQQRAGFHMDRGRLDLQNLQIPICGRSKGQDTYHKPQQAAD